MDSKTYSVTHHVGSYRVREYLENFSFILLCKHFLSLREVLVLRYSTKSKTVWYRHACSTSDDETKWDIRCYLIIITPHKNHVQRSSDPSGGFRIVASACVKSIIEAYDADRCRRLLVHIPLKQYMAHKKYHQADGDGLDLQYVGNRVLHPSMRRYN